MKSHSSFSQNKKIAKRYAWIIFDLAEEGGSLAKISDDLAALRQAITQSPALGHFLSSPSIPGERRETILQELFAEKIQDLTFRFLFLLSQKNRLPLLSGICAAFEDLYLEHEEILKVGVTSARALDAARLNAISTKLKNKFRKEIQLEQIIDPNILGGVRLQIGDTIYDYSITTQLVRFQNRISKL